MRVMEKIGAMVQAWGVMYKAVTLSVLLYGSERWVVTGGMLNFLKLFRHREVRWITGMTASTWSGWGVVIPPGGGGNGRRRSSFHWRVHQEVSGDHSGKCGRPPRDPPYLPVTK